MKSCLQFSHMKYGPLCLILLLSSSLLFSYGLEIPAGDPSDITNHNWYSLKYNETTEQADWAAYELTHEELTGTTPRRDNFRSDPAILSGSAALKDYRGSGYDRGHLVPAGDLKISTDSMSASFYLSNMSPQIPGFNRGIWLDLENYVRTWAWEYGAIYIVTGPLFIDENYTTIGENEVAVPDYFFKVVIDNSSNIKKAVGFIIPNEAVKRPVQDFLVNIDTVEEVTGIDFFYLLDDETEALLESESNLESWIWEEFSFSGRGEQKVEPETPLLYWINLSSGTRHNSSCKYYGNTKSGYYIDKKIGKACGRCGG